MSIEQEQIVRDYLSKRIARWQSWPYDWLDLEPEDLDDMGLVDIPEDVIAAYEATRSNPDDRARDEGDYAQHKSPEETLRESIRFRRAKGLPLVPEFDNFDQWPEAWKAEHEAYRQQVQAFLDSEAPVAAA